MIDAFRYNFPRIRFAGSLLSQMSKIHSEEAEAQHAFHEYMHAVEDLHDAHFTTSHLVEELMDTVHACETALRIIESMDGTDMTKARDAVVEKNTERNYY